MKPALPTRQPPSSHFPTSRTDGPTHDVVIIGGGLVGASLAIALDRLGMDVGQVEASPAGSLPPVLRASTAGTLSGTPACSVR